MLGYQTVHTRNFAYTSSYNAAEGAFYFQFPKNEWDCGDCTNDKLFHLSIEYSIDNGASWHEIITSLAHDRYQGTSKSPNMAYYNEFDTWDYRYWQYRFKALPEFFGKPVKIRHKYSWGDRDDYGHDGNGNMWWNYKDFNVPGIAAPAIIATTEGTHGSIKIDWAKPDLKVYPVDPACCPRARPIESNSSIKIMAGACSRA
jgi:hypothetical protein